MSSSSSDYSAVIASSTVQKNVGNFHFKKGEFDKAIDFFGKALNLLPQNREVSLRQSRNAADKELLFQINNIRTNRVVAASKLERWADVVDDCNKVCGSSGITPGGSDKYTNRCMWFRAKAYEALNQSLYAFYDYQRARMEKMLKSNAELCAKRVWAELEEKSTKLTWTRINSTASGQLEGRFFHTAVTHPDKHSLVIYAGEKAGSLCGGPDSHCDPSFVHLLDVTSFEEDGPNMWRSQKCTGHMPAKSGLSAHSAVVYQRHMYVYGGNFAHSDKATITTDVFALDMDTWIWSKIEVSPTSSYRPTEVPDHHTAIVYGTKMYVFGERRSKLSILSSFDFETRTWSACPTRGGIQPPARHEHQAWLLGNRMYVFGGRVDDGGFEGAYVSDLWFYDFEMEGWEQIKEPRAAGGRTETQACILGAGITDVVVTFGGYLEASNGSTYLDNGLGFQISKNKSGGKVQHFVLLSEKPEDAPSERAGCTVTSVGNRAIVIGGYHGPRMRVFGDAWVMKIQSAGKKKT